MPDPATDATDPTATKPARVIRAPLVPVALALIIGVLLGRSFSLPPVGWLVMAGVATLVAVVTLRRPHLKTAALAAVLVAAGALGGARASLAWYTIDADNITTFTADHRILATVRGRVASYPQRQTSDVEFGYRPEPSLVFLVDVDSIHTASGFRPADGLLRCLLHEPYLSLQPGEPVELAGWLSRYHHPRNPGQFDTAEYARTTGVLARMDLPAVGNVIRLPDQPGFTSRWLWRWRALFRQPLLQAGTDQSGSLLSTLVLGNRPPALSAVNRIARRAGIAHFLAISGMHLGIFLGFVYLLGRLVMFTRRQAAWGALVMLVLYLLLADARAPLLRSGVMAALLLAATIIGRRHSTLNALAAAAILLLAIQPMQLFQAGFQLSFVIVLSIMLLTRPIRRLLFGRWLDQRGLMVFRHDQVLRRWLHFTAADWLMSLVAMSMAAWLAAAPLVVYHFGYISPWGMVLSILLMPLLVVILVPAYLAMLLAMVAPNLSAGLADLAALPAESLLWIIDHLQALPALTGSLRPVSAGWVLLTYVTLAAIILAGRHRLRWLIAGGLLLATIGVTLIEQAPRRTPPATAELHLLAVGAGQCAVLQLPSGRTWLLDAGTRSGFDVYRRTLQPFLRAMKLPPPTTAIVSHDNADHYNGLVELFRERRLGRLYLGPDWPATDASPLKGLVHDNQIELQRLRRGDVIQLDSATRLEVLWPPQEFQPASVNDTSLVCRITCSGKCVLLTGDIDEQAQSALLEDPDRLRADALLLPHHGGWETTLPDFVDAVHPGVILVSSHRDPHGPTTADDKVHDFYRRLHNRYRYASTARDGWIALQFGRSGLSLQTMRQRDRHRPPKK